MSAPPPFSYLDGFTRDQLIAEVLRMEHAAGMDRDSWRRRDEEIRRLRNERDEQAVEIARLRDAVIAAALREP